MGHSRSSTLSPFDRAHTTSYSPLDTICLPRTVYEIYGVICRTLQILPISRAFGAPIGSGFIRISWRSKELASLGCRGVFFLLNPMSSYLDTILTCDGRTDRRTQGYSI